MSDEDPHSLAYESVVAVDGRELARLEWLVPVPGFGSSPIPDRDEAVALSRFSLLRKDARRLLVIENPLTPARVALRSPAALATVGLLAGGVSARECEESVPLDADEVLDLIRLLVRAGVAKPVGGDGRLHEETDSALRQWDFHDLFFHSRSRLGRHDGPFGGRFRFLGDLQPEPAVKSTSWPVAVVLPRPDLLRLSVEDASLTSVLEARRSVRTHQGYPVGLDRLGEFLFRTARVRTRWDAGEKGEFSSRPYPSGGASYELETYLNVGEGAGVSPGFYWYDPVSHALRLVRPPDEDTASLMMRASQSTGGLAWPQVLLILAARFQRVSWKYDAIAYATVLKNVGAVYQTMYLVATAMGLSPCALGIGDADVFARIAGTSYERETSVGEFILGGCASPPRHR